MPGSGSRAQKRRQLKRLMQMPEGDDFELPQPHDFYMPYTAENLSQIVARPRIVRAIEQYTHDDSGVAYTSDPTTPVPSPPASITAPVAASPPAAPSPPATPSPPAVPSPLSAPSVASDLPTNGNCGGQRIQSSPQVQTPIPKATTSFLDLPCEIRQHIMRFLLVADSSILVHDNWRKVYYRSRPGLHIAIMKACRTLYEDGVPILYGYNEFEYLMRDPPLLDDNDVFMIDPSILDDLSDPTFSPESNNGNDEEEDEEEGAINERNIPIEKHISSIRHICFRLEGNRYGPGYMERMNEALLPFTKVKHLHTLRFHTNATGRDRNDVPFIAYFEPDTILMKNVMKVSCQYISFWMTNRKGKDLGILIHRKHGAAIRRARRGVEGYVTDDPAIIQQRENAAREGYERLRNIAQLMAEWTDRASWPARFGNSDEDWEGEEEVQDDDEAFEDFDEVFFEE